jgi:3-oxoacyl-[acyl-carrier protein] reductase
VDLGLTDRVALVTGASRGLGRAVAETLLDEGARVVAVARASEALDALGARIGDRGFVLAGDLRDPVLPARAVEAALARYGRLDVAIVNTPGPPPVQPLDATDADFADAFASTFHPAVRLVRAAAAPMAAGGWGRIVLVSSTSVKAPKPFLCLSAAARSALWAWAKSAAPELQARGVTVNAVFAGPHETARSRALGVQGRPMGRADDFGRLVVALCGEATRFVTGTGHLVDGGELPSV